MRTGRAGLPLRGGKDGIPYSVDRDTYDRSVSGLEVCLRRAKVGPNEREKAFGRLKRLANRG